MTNVNRVVISSEARNLTCARRPFAESRMKAGMTTSGERMPLACPFRRPTETFLILEHGNRGSKSS
jgi:hypothetical protein